MPITTPNPIGNPNPNPMPNPGTVWSSTPLGFLRGLLLMVKVAGPDVDPVTVTCRSSSTSPAQQSAATPRDLGPDSQKILR